MEFRMEICPWCANEARQELIFQRQWVLPEGTELTEYEEELSPPQYFFTICSTCGGPSVYATDPDYSDRYQNFKGADLEWPRVMKLGLSIPEGVREIFQGASRVKLFSPEAFAGQLRRALEAICDDKGVLRERQERKGKRIPAKDRLKELKERGFITEPLLEMAYQIVDLGNRSVHADPEKPKVSAGDVYELDDFFYEIVNAIYIAPERLRRFKLRQEKKLVAFVEEGSQPR